MLDNRKKFNKDKGKLLHLGKTNQYRMGDYWLDGSTADEDLGSLMDHRFIMSWQSDAVTKNKYNSSAALAEELYIKHNR